MAQMVKHLPTMQETWVQPLGWEDVLEKEMATHCSILAWYGPWGRKESDTTEQLHFTLNFSTLLWVQSSKVCLSSKSGEIMHKKTLSFKTQG